LGWRALSLVDPGLAPGVRKPWGLGHKIGMPLKLAFDVLHNPREIVLV
jgi:hypothetical protein